jgi:hypothetical protein
LDRYWFKYEAANYGYAGNDPWNKVDTDGNWPECVNTAASIGAGIVAGVAVTAAAAVLAPAGVGLLGALAIGFLAGAVGGFVENVVESALDNNKEFSWSCALKSAGLGALGGLLGGPLGKLLGRLLKPLGALIGRSLNPAVQWFGKLRMPILGAGSGKWGKMVPSYVKNGTLVQKLRARWYSIRYKIFDPASRIEKDAVYLKFKNSGVNPWHQKEWREHFWKNYNEPFLEKGIKNKETFKYIDNPLDSNYNIFKSKQNRSSLTFMGREVHKLRQAGYTFQESGEYWFAIPPK